MEPDEDFDENFLEKLKRVVNEMRNEERVAIVNPEEYRVAAAAIDEITETLNRHTDKESRPFYKVSYDTLWGTSMAFDIQLHEYDVDFTGRELKRIAELLPDDCNILILPQKDYKAMIQITFHNVRSVFPL
ncbi:MAG: hypothetical protein J5584_01835 [Clostridia bacterium]|nr:hypothetical protein [Clostridia bacterium]